MRLPRFSATSAAMFLCAEAACGAEPLNHPIPYEEAAILSASPDSLAYWLRLRRVLIDSEPEPGTMIVRIFMGAGEPPMGPESVLSLYYVGDFHAKDGSYILEVRHAKELLVGLKEEKPVGLTVHQSPLEKAEALRMQRSWLKQLRRTRYAPPDGRFHFPNCVHAVFALGEGTFIGGASRYDAEKSPRWYMDQAALWGGIWLTRGEHFENAKAKFLDYLRQLEKKK